MSTKHLFKMPALMGILNITPDSFSDGGNYTKQNLAIEQASKMIADGADILDIGAESTRPNAMPITSEEEINRLKSILPHITNFKVPISLDTYKSETALYGLRAGVHYINDVWGLHHSPEIANHVADYNAGLILMHNTKEVLSDTLLLDEILSFWYKSLSIALKAGVDEGKLIFDPGIGFGKSFQQNLIILLNIHVLKSFGFPVLIGASRKRFIGHILDKPVEDRVHGSVSVHQYALMNGADVIRVHDVSAHKDMMKILNAFQNESL